MHIFFSSFMVCIYVLYKVLLTLVYLSFLCLIVCIGWPGLLADNWQNYQ